MAIIKPFPALRPKPDLASRICELPYDVMSSDEARQIAGHNPLSFLHVSKPEIDLPPETNPYSPQVYAKGRENFLKLIAQGALQPDPQPRIYLYRQTMGRHTQTGLVALASCQEYIQNIIKKHELTRPDKEDDRVRHIETLGAQTGPAFLAYRAQPDLDRLFQELTRAQPDIDFTAADNVRHSSWTIAHPDHVAFIQKIFAQLPALYIADGHHRTAAAAHLAQSHPGTDPSAFFLAVIFPHNQLQILPYNRVLKHLNGLTPAQLRRKLEPMFILRDPGHPAPQQKHQLGLFLEGKWQTLTFRPHLTAVDDPIEQLDVTLLQKHVLGPIFGIHNPRTSHDLNFVGGIRGPAELEQLVNSAQYACAFSMFPTHIDDLMAIADAGGIMPPKSTWFEPKLRDAMFCHLIHSPSTR